MWTRQETSVRIHPCTEEPVRSVSVWWRTRSDCCSCRRWRSPEFPHRPPTTVGRCADVTRTTCVDSPIKSWWDTNTLWFYPSQLNWMPRRRDMKCTRRGTVRCGAVRCVARSLQWTRQQSIYIMFLRQRTRLLKNGWTMKEIILLQHKEKRSGKWPINLRCAY